MTFSAWSLAMVYLFCGVGVLMALNDDHKPLGCLGVAIATMCVLIWPLFFMFAMTTALRSVAEQKPYQVTVKRQ